MYVDLFFHLSSIKYQTQQHFIVPRAVCYSVCCPPDSPLLSFFSPCVLDRIVYVAWVWLCASRFWTSMAGTCVDHYLIKVLQYIQPGSVLGLRYPKRLLQSLVLLFLPLVLLSAVLVRGLFEHWHHLRPQFCSYLTDFSTVKGLFKDWKYMQQVSLYYRHSNAVLRHPAPPPCTSAHTWCWNPPSSISSDYFPSKAFHYTTQIGCVCMDICLSSEKKTALQYHFCMQWQWRH